VHLLISARPDRAWARVGAHLGTPEPDGLGEGRVATEFLSGTSEKPSPALTEGKRCNLKSL